MLREIKPCDLQCCLEVDWGTKNMDLKICRIC